MNPIQRAVLAAYPPSFRERYGVEFRALVEDTGTSTSTTLDLMVGAARAWIRPSVVGAEGRRWRLQASVATTWTAWCVGVLIVPAVDWALLDDPTRPVAPAVRALLAVAFALLVVGSLVAIVGSVPIVVSSVLPAARARDWWSLRPLIPVAVLGLVESAGLVAIAASDVGTQTTPSWIARSGIGLWLAGLVLLACAVGIGPAMSVTRLRPPRETLRVPSTFAVLLALVLTLAALASLAAALGARDGTLLGSAAPVWIAITVALIAVAVAATSSVRGLRALTLR